MSKAKKKSAVSTRKFKELRAQIDDVGEDVTRIESEFCLLSP
jgi:hypothetical protein